jgi:hypothetical protein
VARTGAGCRVFNGARCRTSLCGKYAHTLCPYKYMDENRLSFHSHFSKFFNLFIWYRLGTIGPSDPLSDNPRKIN